MTLIADSGFSVSDTEAEAALARACQRGETDAFEEIYRRHSSRLLLQARHRVGSQAEAEDAVQEVWMRAIRALPQFGKEGDLRLGAWLTRILANVCSDMAAARFSEQRKLDRLGAQRESDEADISDMVGDEALRRQLAGALDELPASQRRAFILRALGDMDYADVAAAAGITEANARARVHRARAALARRLSQVALGISGVAALLAGLRRRAGTRDTPQSGGTTVAQGLVNQAVSQPVVQAAMASSASGGRGSLLAGIAATAVSVTTGAAALTGVASGTDHSSSPPPAAVVAMANPAGANSAAPVPTPPPSTTVPTPSTTMAPRVAEMVIQPPDTQPEAAQTVTTSAPARSPVTEPKSTPSATTAPPSPPIAPTMAAPDWAALAIADAASSGGAAVPAPNSGCAGTPPANSTFGNTKASSTAQVTGDLSTGAVDQATVGPKVSISPTALTLNAPGVPGGLPVTLSAQACLSGGSENLMVWFDFHDGSTAMAIGRAVDISSKGDGNGIWFFSGPVESYVPGHDGVIAVTHQIVAEIQTAEPDNTASLAVAFVPNPAPSAGKSGSQTAAKSTATDTSSGTAGGGVQGASQASAPTTSSASSNTTDTGTASGPEGTATTQTTAGSSGTSPATTATGT